MSRHFPYALYALYAEAVAGATKGTSRRPVQPVQPVQVASTSRESTEIMAGNVAAEPFQRVSVQQAKELIDQGVQVVDVRDAKELSQDGALPNAKLVPLNTFLMNPRQHLQGDNVAFLCKVGARSAIACEMAAAVGLTRLYNIEGGIEAWKKAGLPVEYPAKA
jgi:rhodanese-related sulfurtransferase